MIKNTLSRAEQRTLEDLILSEKASIEKGCSCTKFAEFAAKKMRREITVHNVRAASRAVNISFISARGTNKSKLNARINLLAKVLVSLSKHLGEHIPPELQAIVDEAE